MWRNVWLMSLYREGAAESWKAGAVSQAETTRDSPEPTSEKPGLRGQRSKRAGGGGQGGSIRWAWHSRPAHMALGLDH